MKKPGWLKPHYCIKCKKSKIAYSNFLYGSKKCIKCAYKEKLHAHFGKDHWHWKGGLKTKTYYCIICKKNKIHYTTYIKGKKRCQHCCGLLHRGKRGVTRNKIIAHHKDLDVKNDKKNNILKIKAKIHGQLHQQAYRYLVEMKLINKYIKWFFENYKSRKLRNIAKGEEEIVL